MSETPTDDDLIRMIEAEEDVDLGQVILPEAGVVSHLHSHPFEDPLIDHLKRKNAWSESTFGSGKRTKGLIAHIKKELDEIEKDPDDLEEWTDVIILGLDGFFRHGGNPEDVLPMLEKKFQKNMARDWPKPVDENTPVEHVRSVDEEAAKIGTRPGDQLVLTLLKHARLRTPQQFAFISPGFSVQSDEGDRFLKREDGLWENQDDKYNSVQMSKIAKNCELTLVA